MMDMREDNKKQLQPGKDAVPHDVDTLVPTSEISFLIYLFFLRFNES
jgi:hypothetical protein